MVCAGTGCCTDGADDELAEKMMINISNGKVDVYPDALKGYIKDGRDVEMLKTASILFTELLMVKAQGYT